MPAEPPGAWDCMNLQSPSKVYLCLKLFGPCSSWMQAANSQDVSGQVIISDVSTLCYKDIEQECLHLCFCFQFCVLSVHLQVINASLFHMHYKHESRKVWWKNLVIPAPQVDRITCARAHTHTLSNHWATPSMRHHHPQRSPKRRSPFVQL